MAKVAMCLALPLDASTFSLVDLNTSDVRGCMLATQPLSVTHRSATTATFSLSLLHASQPVVDKTIRVGSSSSTHGQRPPSLAATRSGFDETSHPLRAWEVGGSQLALDASSPPSIIPPPIPVASYLPVGVNSLATSTSSREEACQPFCGVTSMVRGLRRGGGVACNGFRSIVASSPSSRLPRSSPCWAGFNFPASPSRCGTDSSLHVSRCQVHNLAALSISRQAFILAACFRDPSAAESNAKSTVHTPSTLPPPHPRFPAQAEVGANEPS
ncbi:hypothetical protein SCHPADRAFT_946642 [Schizopora paradoxa]|uniref:Uncharacterized protein n=1 Tax=Schizopora paradoxa TaxID=27342 RepID=A0A0H2R8B1_9AGAM|nr:hypothetical protein SCHPADRAFT_946642 [Schizopora paradoxa]